MGEEQGLMDRLQAYVDGRPMKPPLSMPENGFGGGTPNHKGLRVACWLVERHDNAAVERAIEYYTEMERAGHCCIGEAKEPLTPSHAQLYYALFAGALEGAMLTKSSDLRAMVEARWRVETAAVRKCLKKVKEGGKDKWRCLTPGARAGTASKPNVENSARTKVIKALGNGWTKVDKPSSPPYEVAIPLLSMAFKHGADPAALWGDDYASLAEQFGYSVNVHDDGFYAWFTKLEGVSDPLYGAGYDGSTRYLFYDQQEANQEGEEQS